MPKIIAVNSFFVIQSRAAFGFGQQHIQEILVECASESVESKVRA
jgi:hypothetical protein